MTAEEDYVPDTTSGDTADGTLLDASATDGVGNTTTVSYPWNVLSLIAASVAGVTCVTVPPAGCRSTVSGGRTGPIGAAADVTDLARATAAA